jgi:hypothetical protein
VDARARERHPRRVVSVVHVRGDGLRAVRDNPAARWLPARRHFALARLVAFIRSRFPTAPRTDVDRFLFAIDRDQTNAEQFAMAILVFATATCEIAAFLSIHWLAAAPVIAVLGIQAIITVSGIGRLGQDHLTRTSSILLTILIAISAYLALQPTPFRYVAWFFLAIVVLDFLAFLVMLALRKQVREMEQRCGI